MQTVVQELAAEAARPAGNPYDALARLSFQSRREIIIAAQQNGGIPDPFSIFTTQHAIIVPAAQTNHNKRGA